VGPAGNPTPGYPPKSADWSELLTRTALRIGNGVLEAARPLDVLNGPAQHVAIEEFLEPGRRAGAELDGDARDLLSALREKFIETARGEIVGRGLRRLF
jgi:hypothetical protein